MSGLIGIVLIVGSIALAVGFGMGVKVGYGMRELEESEREERIWQRIREDIESGGDAA